MLLTQLTSSRRQLTSRRHASAVTIALLLLPALSLFWLPLLLAPPFGVDAKADTRSLLQQDTDGVTTPQAPATPGINVNVMNVSESGTASPPPPSLVVTAAATLPGDVAAVRSCLPFNILILPGRSPTTGIVGANPPITSDLVSGGEQHDRGRPRLSGNAFPLRHPPTKPPAVSGGASAAGVGGSGVTGNASIAMQSDMDVVTATDIKYSQSDGILSLELSQVQRVRQTGEVEMVTGWWRRAREGEGGRERSSAHAP